MNVVFAIRHHGSRRFTTELMRCMSDRKDEVRIAASGVLCLFKNLESMDVMIAGMEDPCPGVRMNCAVGLGEIGDLRSLDALVLRCKDDHPEVRSKVARAPGRMKSYDAVYNLIQLIDDQEEKQKFKRSHLLACCSAR